MRDPGPAFLDPQLGGGPGDFEGSEELERCCLARTLFSHNGRPTEEGGAEVRPDLASALPEVSPDGLTWTIRIQQGLHYGPPLQDVEITAGDFIRSLHRLEAPDLWQLGYFAWEYTAIQGVTEYESGKAPSISGLEAPDDHTLVIRLDRPKGDLSALLAEPAAAPLPPDPARPDAAFGIADGADAGFGRFLVSSGPYMVEGSEKLDFSVPAASRASPTGIAPGRITLVRNPSWQRASDPLRPAYPDRIEIALVDTLDQAVAAIDAGTADLVWSLGGRSPSLPADVFDAFRANPSRGTIHLNATAAVRYAVLNVAVPPFDDLHVRRAISYAIDRRHLVDLQGGPVGGQVHGHLLPDVLEENLLVDYDPYRTPGGTGDVGAARAEMARSAYDANGDGRCDAVVCTHVRALTRDPYGEVAASIADDLEPLGIHLDVETVDRDTLFTAAQRPKEQIPLLLGLGFRGNYIGGAGFLLNFSGAESIGGDFYNYTMVGATAEQLTSWGYAVTDVPNVDDRMAACVPLAGAAQLQCVAAADQFLMENVVPMIPYSQDRYAALVSPRVVAYGYDELAQTTALDQLALKQ